MGLRPAGELRRSARRRRDGRWLCRHQLRPARSHARPARAADAERLAGRFTWFRVGGPAQVLFSPTDEDDLAYFLERLPVEIPVTVVGLGSNLIVRDGGVPAS